MPPLILSWLTVEFYICGFLNCRVNETMFQPVEKVQITDLKDKGIPYDLFILSCIDDEAICLPFVEKGILLPLHLFFYKTLDHLIRKL